MPYRLVCEECGHNATITDTAPLCNRCYNRLVQEAEEQNCNEPYPLYDWEQDALAPEDADPGWADGDLETGLASAGYGTDEDYGYFGDDSE